MRLAHASATAQIREVQRDIADRHGLVYWNWASIMPSECGAHRWYSASPQLMAKDHVHFTIEGYKKSADQFLRTLDPRYRKGAGRGKCYFPQLSLRYSLRLSFLSPGS